MEKRMFKFGDSSLALIVPKKWVDKNGLDPSSPVSISENKNGDLVISTTAEPVKDREETIESDMSPEALGRLIGLHYMFGTTKLRLYFKNGYGNAGIRKITEVIKDECPGFEIISHSAKDVFIEDFNNLRETDILKIISRLRLIVKQEFKEIREGDVLALQDSEKLVNRFYMLGVRHINVLATEDSTRYFVLLQMLEMISDNLNLLCQPDVIKDMKIMGKLEEQLDMCFLGLDGKEESTEKAMWLREEIFRSSSSLRLDKLKIHAIREITNEISRISEFGLYLKR